MVIGNGCGHTKLWVESGTLASPNYPYTYPQHVSCTWTLRVPRGRTLRLVFGDLDIKGSEDCSSGSLVITPSNGTPSIGPLCRLTTEEMKVSVNSSEAKVVFWSGGHLSGRGFLLSYSTDQFPELISCKKRGSLFTSDQLSVYCPAGCKDAPYNPVKGDVWGNNEQGYRDTSLVCKSAVHAGVVSDSLGGNVSAALQKGRTRYDSTFANGVLSKTGPLSDRKMLFSQECNDNLMASVANTSSSWGNAGSQTSPRSSPSETWAADDRNPWVELELRERSTVTGIITTGSAKSYIQNYTLRFSKDRRSWKPYLLKGAASRDIKVLEAYSEGHVSVLNSLHPPPVARFVQLKALSWHGRASAQVQVLGCPAPRARTSPATAKTNQLNQTATRQSVVSSRLQSERLSGTHCGFPRGRSPVGFSHMVVGVVIGLVVFAICLLAGFWWRRRRGGTCLTCVCPVGCQHVQGKRGTAGSEVMSYPLERHDTAPAPPLNNYAEPAAGSPALGSTFRPGPAQDHAALYSFVQHRAPGHLPEYAQPLPPEPEYATPFGEQLPDGRDPPPGAWTGLPPPPPPPPACGDSPPGPSHYDCPSHRVLSDGYCTPSHRGAAPLLASGPYSVLQLADAQDKHTYEELL
ncbi:unnamed protein product [Merluccius merluccius]